MSDAAPPSPAQPQPLEGQPPAPAPALPRAYRLIRGFLRALLLVFFRRVELTGVEHVPARGGGIVVSWHPNGLVDPALILARFPRQVVFGARHGLFAWPLLGWLLRRVGTVPIYRAVDQGERGDPEARRLANRRSLEALAAEVARGSFAALFPEGVSHDDPRPAELKPGVARLYALARSLQPPGAPPPVIVPVGLHYDAKAVFRSDALVAFHPPLDLPANLVAPSPPDEPAEAERERVRALTAEVDRVLHDVVLATESWELHRLMHRGRALLRAERAVRRGRAPAPAGMVERTLGFARVRLGYHERRRTNPELVAGLQARVESYDEAMRLMDLRDEDIDRDPRLASSWLGAILLLQVVGVFLLLPPILFAGYLINLPTALGLALLARLASRKRKDEATVKILVGALLFPLTWLGWGLLAAWGHARLHQAFPSIPDQAALAGTLTALLGAVGGAVAVRYRRVARETLRAVKVRLTRRQRTEALAFLRAERAALADAIEALGEGLPLPGVVGSDGSIRVV